MAGRSKIELCRLLRNCQRCSHCVLRGEFEIRPGDPEGAWPRCAGSACAVPPQPTTLPARAARSLDIVAPSGIDLRAADGVRHRQGGGTKVAATHGQARRRRHGSGGFPAAEAARYLPNCRAAPQARSGRRPRTRRAGCRPTRSTATRPSARRAMTVRRRVTVNFACANPAAAQKASARDHGGIADGVVMAARPHQRARQRALPQRVRAPDFGADQARRRGRRRSTSRPCASSAMHALLGVGQRLGATIPGLSSCAGTAASAAAIRSPSSARASASIPAASSIKPASGMEDMKGDMAGAACVVGLMQTLAARKAKVNAVGAIGLVENMPDGNAQRPGDDRQDRHVGPDQIEDHQHRCRRPRLVLADVLHYVNNRFKPKFMINLATLTGAIIVALGQRLPPACSPTTISSPSGSLKAGRGDRRTRVWRMPLGPEYDQDAQIPDSPT